MTNFCTLFNSTYLTRGLAMYQSLEKYCPDFHLYVIAFDQHCYAVLVALQLQSATVISLEEFENADLLRIKPTRTAIEYCWTCTPSSLAYCLDQFQLEACTYLDADLLFFSDPSVLLDEMADNSVLLTEHRYTQQYDQTEISGKYCVQFLCIKNDTRGRGILHWWIMACQEWCYNRVEDNKFGDQKYLDDWCERFEGVHALRHLGGGVAPWNMQQYDFYESANHLTGKESATGKTFKVVFFHFHCFRYYKTNVFQLAGPYELNENLLSLFYGPYINNLHQIRKFLKDNIPLQHNKGHESLAVKKVFHSPLRIYKLYIRGNFRSYYHQSYFVNRGYGLSNQS